MVTQADRSLLAVQVERPTPGPTQVLIEVAVAGVNPVDWKTRQNADIDISTPDILGEAGSPIGKLVATLD